MERKSIHEKILTRAKEIPDNATELHVLIKTKNKDHIRETIKLPDDNELFIAIMADID